MRGQEPVRRLQVRIEFQRMIERRHNLRVPDQDRLNKAHLEAARPLRRFPQEFGIRDAE